MDQRPDEEGADEEVQEEKKRKKERRPDEKGADEEVQEEKKRKKEQRPDEEGTDEEVQEEKMEKKKKKRQKVHGDSVPEIIEGVRPGHGLSDDDTYALAKFREDVSQPLAHAQHQRAMDPWTSMDIHGLASRRKKLFLDICGGAGDVARRAASCHDHIAVGMDWKQGPIQVDLKKPCIYNYIEKEMVEEDLVGSGMVHCPCETWSSARHGRPGDGTPVPLRDRKEHIWGIPGLPIRDQLKLEEGNRITRACLKYCDLLRRHQVPCGLENGDLSMLWAVPEIAEEMHRADVLKISYCMMGKPFRKTTRLVVWSVKNGAVLKEQAALCRKEYFCASPGGVCKRTGKKHLVLRGWCREGALTKWGERYPKKFVNVIAKVLCS